MNNLTPNKIAENKKPCINCGAELKYKAGSTVLKCDYCSHEESISLEKNKFQELELIPYLNSVGNQSHTEKISMICCKKCGANQHIEENYKSLNCIYCSQQLTLEDSQDEDWILPGAILPFQINQKDSFKLFQKWVKGLWFAPNNLQKAALNPENTKGLYLPFWTFDAQLSASYTGERGIYYYVTETQYVNGKHRSRQVRKTRWEGASGEIEGFVDDTLINASKKQSTNIPSDITNWDLKKLVNFDSKFLSGYVTEKYTLPLKDGHLKSNSEAELIARKWIKRDIGGDTQRIHNMNMGLKEEKFKHILLPIYISSYLFNNKNYNFYVNGENGKISGDRPYSIWKIFMAVILGLIVAGILYYFFEVF